MPEKAECGRLYAIFENLCNSIVKMMFYLCKVQIVKLICNLQNFADG